MRGEAESPTILAEIAGAVLSAVQAGLSQADKQLTRRRKSEPPSAHAGGGFFAFRGHATFLGKAAMCETYLNNEIINTNIAIKMIDTTRRVSHI